MGKTRSHIANPTIQKSNFGCDLVCSLVCRFKDNFVLELDFEPFNASFPRQTLSKSIGNGVQFLNRHLSSKMFHDKESLHPLLDFLRSHSYKGMVSILPMIYLLISIFKILTKDWLLF